MEQSSPEPLPASPQLRWPQRLHPRSSRDILLFCLAACLLLCGVPLLVPTHPSFSQSYCFGYNNRAACLVLGLVAALFAGWSGQSELYADIEASPDRSSGVGRGALLLALFAGSLATATMWLFATWGGPTGEAVYMLERLGHLGAGERVYRDFEFAYGAGLLHLPWWFSQGLHLSPLNGYFLALFAEWLIGTCLVAYCVGTLRPHYGLRSGRANAIFLILVFTSLSWFVLTGSQYTPLRYWLAPATVICSWEQFHRAPGAPYRAAAVSLCGFAAALWLFPEQAIALVAGSVLFFAVVPRQSRPVYLSYLPLALGALPAFAMAKRLGLFDTAAAMASGGYSFPVTLAPYLFVGVLLILMSACCFVKNLRSRSLAQPGVHLMCVGICLLPAALSRFDDVHFLSNTFCLCLMGWMVAARSESLWRWTVTLYALAVLLLPLPFRMRDCLYLGRQALQARSAQSAAAPNLVRPSRPLPRPLYAPVGVPDAAPASRQDSSSIAFGRFFGMENVLTRGQAQQKAVEIRAHAAEPILVAPYSCALAGSNREVMSFTKGLFVWKHRHVSNALQPICDELDRHWVGLSTPGLPRGERLEVFRP